MAQALNAGPAPRRRALFGLLDADGWGWASVKAFLWFILIIFMLGYLPDRAYYLTVNRTIDLGILAFSPVNFCPPENETLPCPAPQGAVLPWHPSPPELSLPAPRTDGGAVQVGSRLLYIGGSDGQAASDVVYVAPTVGTGNFDKWTADGPKLPEPRADAGVAFFGGSIYVVGGFDAAGKPTTSTFILTPDAQTGDLGQWQTAADAKLPLDLPEARAGAALVPLADGLLVVGGTGPDGKATATSWKSSLVDAKLDAWTASPKQLIVPVTDAVAVQNGDYVWVYGGTDDQGRPTGAVQRGTLASGPAQGGASGSSGGTGGSASGSGGTTPGAANVSAVTEWGVRNEGNLPEARTNAVGWSANGTLYLVGGSDGTNPRTELYWTIPHPGGGNLGDVIDTWHHLPQSDYGAQGIAGAAPIISGPDVIVVGGTTPAGVVPNAARANTAPQEPFFQLGFLGATVPALKIDGEIGQQLGYINAATVGGINFALLVIVGVLIAHRQRTGAWWNPVRTWRSRRGG